MHISHIENKIVYVPTDALGGHMNTGLVGNLLARLATIGHTLNEDGIERLLRAKPEDVRSFGIDLIALIERSYRLDEKMEDFVVYKNFPAEVLNMSESEYWLKQIFIYLGADYDQFGLREAEQSRPPLEDITLKIIRHYDTPNEFVMTNLMAQGAQWTPIQQEWANHFFQGEKINLSDFSFISNGVSVIGDKGFNTTRVTDILRYAAHVSGGDPTLRQKSKFVIRRPQRKMILEALSSFTDDELELGFAKHKEEWKRVMHIVRPRSSGYENVARMADLLSKDKIKSELARIEMNPDEPIRQAGIARRMFRARYKRNREVAMNDVRTHMFRWTNREIVSFFNNLMMETRVFRPHAKWERAITKVDNRPKIAESDLSELRGLAHDIMSARHHTAFPNGVDLDMGLHDVRLIQSDQEGLVGRGTVLEIPEGMTFLRSSSFWKLPRSGNTWMDNGWLFFDGDHKFIQHVDWNSPGDVGYGSSRNGFGAIFSGDPSNANDLEGRGCQLIDLDIEQLLKSGVRYAVSTILSFNSIPFNEADDVFVTFQWGENAQEGKLFEVSRINAKFEIKSSAKAHSPVVIDLLERKIIFIDIPLGSRTSSASSHSRYFENNLRGILEHSQRNPSVFELMMDAPKGNTPFVLTDSENSINAERAYVARPTNAQSKYEAINTSEFE